MAKVKIVLCDDNESIRLTLVRALKYKKDIEVLGEASSFEELLEVLPSVKPDVILMDVNMPGMSGVEGIKKLREMGDATPVIIMTADKRNEGPALAAGAASFFYKGSTDLGELVENIRAAARS